MQLLSSLALLATPALVYSIALPEPNPIANAFPLPEPFVGFSAQTPIGAEKALKVPGDNPLYYCSAPDEDIAHIDKVDISPNPPLAGKTLTITATGTFDKTIEEGAKALVQVKYGLIKLISQEIDVCKELTNVDMECPLEKGRLTLSKDVDLPKEIPPGKYSVYADVLTKDDERITCLKANVAFDMPRW